MRELSNAEIKAVSGGTVTSPYFGPHPLPQAPTPTMPSYTTPPYQTNPDAGSLK